jgi:hypothetical protein
MRVSRGEGWVMLKLIHTLPPIVFFSTLNTLTPSRQRHGCTQPHHSTPSALSSSYFTLSTLPSSLVPPCTIPALSGRPYTPAHFNAKYCLPCLIYPRLALFVCCASVVPLESQAFFYIFESFFRIIFSLFVFDN